MLVLAGPPGQTAGNGRIVGVRYPLHGLLSLTDVVRGFFSYGSEMALILTWNEVARNATKRVVLAWGAVVLLGGVAGAQVVKAPRYTGGVEAPTPQLTLPAPPAAISKGGTVVEDVVARVNDQIITRSDVERSEQQLQQDAQQQQLSGADLAQRQRDMLRDMIDQQLLLSKAKALGLNAEADVVRQLDEIRKQNHLDSLEALEQAAKQQGVSFEDFKAKIRDQILTREVVQNEVGRAAADVAGG